MRSGNKIQHGHSMHGGSPTYLSWSHMMGRCLNHSHHAYHNYGGRGIAVCDRWKQFEGFLSDMGERPLGKTLDRYPDKNGNYEPGNCRWATWDEQGNNRRDNVILSVQGESMTLIRWARKTGLSPQVINYRMKKMGWSAEKALTTPLMRNRTKEKT